jgi:hypothetical protein
LTSFPRWWIWGFWHARPDFGATVMTFRGLTKSIIYPKSNNPYYPVMMNYGQILG